MSTSSRTEDDTADPAPRPESLREPSDALAELSRELDDLRRASGAERTSESDRRALRVRHLAGIELLRLPPANPVYATGAFDLLADGTTLLEVARADLTAELLRAAILRRGCLLVRGLVDPEVALKLAEGIDRAFADRSAKAAGSPSDGYYRVFAPEPPYLGTLSERPWIEQGGGLLAVDAPMLLADAFEALDRAGFTDVVAAYLGEPPAISAQKTTLRKADPQVAGAWHQDGKFLGNVRALNLWLSLSSCGDEAPGLDIVPRRVEHLLESGGEGIFPIQISQENAEQAAGEDGILRPIFEPGDALLFDELFLHKTGSDPAMPKPRYAIESWFFGPSAFPEEYAPLAA